MTLNERIARGIYAWKVTFLNPRMGFRKSVHSDCRTMQEAIDGARDLLAFTGYDVDNLDPVEVVRGVCVRPLTEAEAAEIEDAERV